MLGISESKLGSAFQTVFALIKIFNVSGKIKHKGQGVCWFMSEMILNVFEEKIWKRSTSKACGLKFVQKIASHF